MDVVAPAVIAAIHDATGAWVTGAAGHAGEGPRRAGTPRNGPAAAAPPASRPRRRGGPVVTTTVPTRATHFSVNGTRSRSQGPAASACWTPACASTLASSAPRRAAARGSAAPATVLVDGTPVLSCLVGRPGGGPRCPNRRGAAGRRSARPGPGSLRRLGRRPVRDLHAGLLNVRAGSSTRRRADRRCDPPRSSPGNLCRCTGT